MSFEILSNASAHVHPLVESYALFIGFPPNTTTLKKGTSVKLLATGKVAAVTSPLDHILGTVTVGSDDLTKNVTVLTNFSMHKVAQAGANIAPGQRVCITGHNADGQPIVVPATERFYAYGMCIKGGASGGDVHIGVFRTPEIMPSS